MGVNRQEAVVVFDLHDPTIARLHALTTTACGRREDHRPLSALTSMPRCQPVRRRPKMEVTVPSTGQAKGGAVSTKSGTASADPTGGRVLAGARGPVGVRTDATTATLPEGIVSF